MFTMTSRNSWESSGRPGTETIDKQCITGTLLDTSSDRVLSSEEEACKDTQQGLVILEKTDSIKRNI